MQKHTKLYLKACGYDSTDFIPSEITFQRGIDIHHIISRGKGGEDRIENLMCLTREQHLCFGDKKDWMYFLLTKHNSFLIQKNVVFEQAYFDEMLHKYQDTLCE